MAAVACLRRLHAQGSNALPLFQALVPPADLPPLACPAGGLLQPCPAAGLLHVLPALLFRRPWASRKWRCCSSPPAASRTSGSGACGCGMRQTWCRFRRCRRCRWAAGRRPRGSCLRSRRPCRIVPVHATTACPPATGLVAVATRHRPCRPHSTAQAGLCGNGSSGAAPDGFWQQLRHSCSLAPPVATPTGLPPVELPPQHLFSIYAHAPPEYQGGLTGSSSCLLLRAGHRLYLAVQPQGAHCGQAAKQRRTFAVAASCTVAVPPSSTTEMNADRHGRTLRPPRAAGLEYQPLFVGRVVPTRHKTECAPVCRRAGCSLPARAALAALQWRAPSRSLTCRATPSPAVAGGEASPFWMLRRRCCRRRSGTR